jgi:hypothetical protein
MNQSQGLLGIPRRPCSSYFEYTKGLPLEISVDAFVSCRLVKSPMSPKAFPEYIYSRSRNSDASNFRHQNTVAPRLGHARLGRI